MPDRRGPIPRDSSMRFDLAGPHWRFALTVYGTPGVPDVCLFLQDSFGVDVNVLLIALFAAKRGRPLSRAELAALDSGVEGWREDVVRPLRTIRRAMKAKTTPAFGPEAEIVRQQVKAVELSAEQFEQAILAQRLSDLPPSPGRAEPGSGSADLVGTIRDVVSLYAGGETDVRPGELDRAIETIVAATADASLPGTCLP